jgi:hypothetical protein
VQTFAAWIQKRRRLRGDYQNEATLQKLRMRKAQNSELNANTPQSLNLIEVCVSPDTHFKSTPPLEVILPSGAVVRISHESQIGLLKSLLAQLPC